MFVHFRGIVRHAKTLTSCMFSVFLEVHNFCIFRVFGSYVNIQPLFLIQKVNVDMLSLVC
jgi:hypothetical protein